MKKRILMTSLALVLALAIAIPMALPVAAYSFPSTNQLNKDQLVPGREGQLAPYVDLVQAGVGYVDLSFVGGYAGGAWFEYRIDGTVKTSGTPHLVVIGDYIYPNIGVAANTIVPITISATVKVEIRLALGGERDWDFDWTTFYVLPDVEGPITSNVVASPNLVEVGAHVTLTANIDDTTTGGSNIASAEYSLDGGTNWFSMDASDGIFDEVSEDVEATFNADSEAGIYTYNLCVRGTDVFDNTGTEECTELMLVVYDPTGGFVTGGGWIDSPSGAYRVAYQYENQNLLNWQSGNFAEVFDLTTSDLVLSYTIDMSGIANAGWALTEVGLREVGAPNIDPNLQGGWMQSNYVFGVLNPTGQNLNDMHLLSKHGWSFQEYDADGPESLITPYWSGSNYAFWFDRDGVDPWQDDDPATPSPGGSSVPWGVGDSVTYNTSGVYDIVLTYHAIDATTATMFATVNGIPQGLYIGGSKNAPPEFYPAGRSFTGDMTQMQVFFGRGGGDGSVVLSNIMVTDVTALAGKATFGFVAKYKKGASVPDGNTQFIFQTAGLNFHSSSYDWLVVTGSDYAKFKGLGTINGMGDYKFMLWAGDSDPDTFRIKIWTEDNNVETVIYDNGMHQSIEGGNIVVHKSKK